MNDIDNTIERRLKTEYFRADHLGFGVSKQGVGLAERYVPRLAQIVAADRAGPSRCRLGVVSALMLGHRVPLGLAQEPQAGSRITTLQRRQSGRCIRPNSHPIPSATIAVVYG